MTAQERLDLVTGLLEAAGARVTSVTPLADPADPHTVVAHDVRASSRTPTIDQAARRILAEHAVPISGLVPWIDPDAPVWDDETGGAL